MLGLMGGIKMIRNNNAIFGYGDIRITSAIIQGVGCLGLSSTEKRPIGSSEPIEKPLEEALLDITKSEMLLTFDNVKSLEVVILKLQEVRAMMLGCDLTTVEEWKQLYNITSIYQPNAMIDANLPEEVEDEQL